MTPNTDPVQLIAAIRRILAAPAPAIAPTDLNFTEEDLALLRALIRLIYSSSANVPEAVATLTTKIEDVTRDNLRLKEYADKTLGLWEKEGQKVLALESKLEELQKANPVAVHNDLFQRQVFCLVHALAAPPLDGQQSREQRHAISSLKDLLKERRSLKGQNTSLRFRLQESQRHADLLDKALKASDAPVQAPAMNREATLLVESLTSYTAALKAKQAQEMLPVLEDKNFAMANAMYPAVRFDVPSFLSYGTVTFFTREQGPGCHGVLALSRNGTVQVVYRQAMEGTVPLVVNRALSQTDAVTLADASCRSSLSVHTLLLLGIQA